jgi:methyl acetate hydrolase
LNKANFPQGRKAGSGSWAGFAKLYYFIDPTAMKAGTVATSLLPFMDRTVLTLFDAVECEWAVYVRSIVS